MARSESLGWHFIHAGRRIWRASKVEIRRLALEIADRTGKPVTVRPGRGTTRPPAAKRKVMKRNPDPGAFLHVLEQMEKGKAARREYVARTKGRRIAMSEKRRGGSSEPAPARKSAKFVVLAQSRKDRLELYRPSRAAANQLAGQLEAAGYTVTVKEV